GVVQVGGDPLEAVQGVGRAAEIDHDDREQRIGLRHEGSLLARMVPRSLAGAHYMADARTLLKSEPVCRQAAAARPVPFAASAAEMDHDDREQRIGLRHEGSLLARMVPRRLAGAHSVADARTLLKSDSVCRQAAAACPSPLTASATLHM